MKLLALALLPASLAHLALYHPSMYGFKPDNPWSWEQCEPLDGLKFKDWWFHGYMSEPPADGVFMELPAGGVFHAEISCNKALTSFRKESPELPPIPFMACDGPGDNGAMGAIHATDMFPGPALGESKSVKGAGLGIAYNSDASKVRPEDFVVISVNHSAPWTREADFAIPAGLPACPSGGCHCMWGWIPDPMNVQQMYTLVYRCNVTGETGSEYPAPAQVARKCPFDKNNCTIGAKQMHYQFQAEGNNNHQGRMDPAFYNYEYGFHDGAQTDIWSTDDGSTWNTDPSDLAPSPPETLTSVPWAPSQNPTWTVTPDSRGTPSGKPNNEPKADIPPTPTPSVSVFGAAAAAASAALPGGNVHAASPSPDDAAAPSGASGPYTATTISAEPTRTGRCRDKRRLH